MSRTTTLLLLIIAAFFTGCCYTTKLSIRDKEYNYYTSLLDSADHLSTDKQKIKYFTARLKGHISGVKARLANAEVLLDLCNTKSTPDSIKDFMASICEAGFFSRKFDMEQPTEMFYRFDPPNNQGLGTMALSDRYRNGFFDEQSAGDRDYIKKFNYTFPRIYFIRKNELHILSGECDLTDRKVFKRLKVESDTIFYKSSAFRKNNNDEIYDINYIFKYVLYSDIEDRWLSIASSKEDSTLVTKDWVNFISFAKLKKIILQKHVVAASLNIDLNDANYEGHWFYAGTLNPLGNWESNYTTIDKEKSIETYITDTAKKHLEVRTMLYVRETPPGDYASDPSLQHFKGNINGSLEPKQKIRICDQRRVRDMNGNFSVWMQIGSVE